jgi:hypothetical protein
MKLRTIKIGSIGLVAALMATSCSQDLMTDINQNPNQAEDAPLSTIVTSALTGSILPIEGENARIAGIWAQNFKGTDRQYSAYDVYGVTASDFHWEHFYYGNIQQANIAIDKAGQNQFYSGICKVTKANSFGLMTSLWGDIPFSEANDLVNLPNPKLDAQSDVYSGVQAMLDEAIADLNSGNGTDDAGVDFFYSGSNESWIKAANTMKARYYMHVGDYSAAETAANAGITDPASNMLIPHEGVYGQNMNVYSSFGEQDRQGYMAATEAYLPTILDSLGAKNDAKTDESARFADLYIGKGSPADYDLNYSGGLFSATSSFPVATASETHLILAEIASRNSNDADALFHLNAVRQFLAAKYPSGQYDDYAASDFATSADLLYAIMLEKYCSMVGQIEVFNDLRRSKNLIGIQPKGTAVKLPQRYLIPQDELNGNTSISTSGDLFQETPVNQ